MAELQQICEFPSSGSNGSADPEAPPANYVRRRSRAVLYQLSGHYNKQDHKMKRTKLKLNNSLLQPRSAAAPLPEYKAAAAGEKSRLVLRHYGTFKAAWDWLMLLATTYVAVAVPYNASFVASDRPSVVSDVLVEALFILDIILNFRTTYVSGKGEVVSDGRSIALHYLRGWFLVDLLAALPFDLLYASDLYGGEESGHGGRVHLLKLTRLLRLARLLQRMDRHSQHSAAILSLLMLSFTLLAHWLACLWYVVADTERSRHKADWDLGWIHHMADRLKMNITSVTHAESYITALYFTCSSLTSVGFGNVSPNTNSEKIFSICTMLIGALMHAVVFGNVTAIIQRMYSRRSQYQSKWRDLKDFLALHAVPKELRQRMLDYFQATWALYHGIDTHETLKEFPEELRGDVSMHLHREILSLPIFEGAPQGCLKLLSLHIRSNFCAPGEYLLHKGDALHSLYYICNGSMEVVQDGMVVAILGKGDLVGCDINAYVGQFSGGSGINSGDGKNLVGGGGCSNQSGGGGGPDANAVVKSSCDVRALTYCDLKCVSVAGLAEALRLYPEFLAQFAADITHDLTYNLREGYEAEQEWDTNGGAPSLTLPSISEEEDEEDDKREGSPSTPPTIIKTSPSLVKSQKIKPTTPRAAEGVKHFEYGIGRVPARVKDTHSSPNSPRSGVGHHRRARRRSTDDDEDRGHHDGVGISGTKVSESSQLVQSSLQEDVALLSQEVRSALQALQALARSSNNCLHCSGHLHGGQRQRTPSPGSSSSMGKPVLSHPTLTLLSPHAAEEAPLRRCSSQPPNMFLATSGDEGHSRRTSETTSTIQCSDFTRCSHGSPISVPVRTSSAVSLGAVFSDTQNNMQHSGYSSYQDNQIQTPEPFESAANATYQVPAKASIYVVTSESGSNLKCQDTEVLGTQSNGLYDGEDIKTKWIPTSCSSQHSCHHKQQTSDTTVPSSGVCEKKVESPTISTNVPAGNLHSLPKRDLESTAERISGISLNSRSSSLSSSSSSLLSTSTVAQAHALDSGSGFEEDPSASKLLPSCFPSTSPSYTSTTTWTKPSPSPSDVSRLATPPRLSPPLTLSLSMPLSLSSSPGTSSNVQYSSISSSGHPPPKPTDMKASPQIMLPSITEQRSIRGSVTGASGRHRRSLPTNPPPGDLYSTDFKPLSPPYKSQPMPEEFTRDNATIMHPQSSRTSLKTAFQETHIQQPSFPADSIKASDSTCCSSTNVPLPCSPSTCHPIPDPPVTTKMYPYKSQMTRCDFLNERNILTTQNIVSPPLISPHSSTASMHSAPTCSRHLKSHSVSCPWLSHQPTSPTSPLQSSKDRFSISLNKTPSLPSLSASMHPKGVYHQCSLPQCFPREGQQTYGSSMCSNASFPTTSYRYSSPSHTSLLANYSSSLTVIPHDSENVNLMSSAYPPSHSTPQSSITSLLPSPHHGQVPSTHCSRSTSSDFASLAPLEIGIQPLSTLVLPPTSPSMTSSASTQTEEDSWIPYFVLANRERILRILGVNLPTKSKGRSGSSVSRSMSDPLHRTKSISSPMTLPAWSSLQWQRDSSNPMEPLVAMESTSRRSQTFQQSHRRATSRADREAELFSHLTDMNKEKT